LSTIKKCILLDTFPPTFQVPSHFLFVQADLSHYDKEWAKYFAGIDCVIHLANFGFLFKSVEETWTSVAQHIEMNSVVFNVAASYGVSRVIFSSTNHVMGGWRTKNLREGELTTKLTPLPGTVYDFDGIHFDSTGYATQKLAAECVGKSLVDSGLLKRFIVLRIGWCQGDENTKETLTLKNHTGTSRDIEEPKDLLKWFKALWISNRDLCHLIERTIQVTVSTVLKFDFTTLRLISLDFM